jgi:hypothetical protein
MSYDRWPPTSEPQRLAEVSDPAEDRLDGGSYRRAADPRPVAERPRAPRGYPARERDLGGYGPRVQRRAARRRAQQRRRRALAILILISVVGTIGFLVLRSSGDPAPQTQPEPAASQGAPSSEAKPAPAPSEEIKPAVAADPAGVPQIGPGTFAYATGTGKTLGTAGTLRRYQVAVEKDTGQNAATFGAAVDRILGDSRSWIAAGKSRFQRVPSGSSHEFVIYLATPATSEKMCAAGGLYTDKFTSCRLPGQVIINLARWLTGVPDYGAPLGVYQAYAVNHEVGHQLGLYHEACPGRGQAAPVMQQQTYGLDGCVANGWPYVGGVRVTGPSVP